MRLRPAEFESGDILSCWRYPTGADHDKWIFASFVDGSNIILITIVRTIIIADSVAVKTFDGQTFYCIDRSDYECVSRSYEATSIKV